MLKSSSESLVSRQEETTQNGAEMVAVEAERMLASELNYVSQPISSSSHCVLFIVKVKTKKKMKTLNHENRAHAALNKEPLEPITAQNERYTVQLYTGCRIRKKS
jgi:hypothetical protein